MDEMISCLLEALVPGLPCRQEARTHPYTRRGRQVDVLHEGRLVEVWECGPGLIQTCSPRRDWPAIAAWPWAWALTAC